ncbi:MAG: phosphodiesterase, partial [Bdellovibrio sp.]|nr:phosphodiesterase [Bdellovibrio sp.]
MTNSHSTQITVLTQGKQPYAYRVTDSQGRPVACQIWDHDFRSYYHQGIDKLWITGLEPGITYHLEVLDKDRGAVLDERLFKSLPLNKTKNLRFALVSCACDFFKTHARVMWDLLFAQKPDMIFLIGDSVYADFFSNGSESDIWRRYCETRSRLRHFIQPSLIPTLATWDDHDFGKNNACKDYPLKATTKRIFDLFWGCKETDGFKRTFGVGSEFAGFGQRFFFMDDRFYRDQPGVGGMHWGSSQQDRLFESLQQNNTPAWIFNGSQFFGFYKKQESFLKDYAKNFADVLRKLARVEAPVVFGSGDVHFSEVLGIEPKILGYKTYEYTSSSIHSLNFPVRPFYKNSRREEYHWHHNFMIVDSSSMGNALDIN